VKAARAFRFLVGACCLLALVSIARAHRPMLEDQFTNPNHVAPCDNFSQFSQRALTISDPTLGSLAIYGRLESPNEIDLYGFVPSKSESIPIEAMVPVREFNYNFRPAVAVIGRDIAPSEASNSASILPLTLPEGFQARVITPPEGARGAFFEKRT